VVEDGLGRFLGNVTRPLILGNGLRGFVAAQECRDVEHLIKVVKISSVIYNILTCGWNMQKNELVFQTINVKRRENEFLTDF
jgi:hypothetical protein